MSEDLLQGVKVAYALNIYDGVLSGHAWYQGKYCYFVVHDDEEGTYALHELTGQTLLRAVLDRQVFEDLVGHHNTYTLSPRPHFSEATALDFNGFYGRLGSERTKYKEICDEPMDRDEMIFLGMFRLYDSHDDV